MKKTILIVDDAEMERDLLYQMFQNDYNVVMAKDGKEAITQLNKYYRDVVVVLLDLIMPVLNGYQVLQVLKASPVFKDIPVAMVTSNSDQAIETACYTMGAMSVIHKPFVAKVVRKQVDNIIDMYEHSLELKLTLNEQLEKLNTYYNNLTDAISNLVEFRDMGSGMHIKRVKIMTQIMAETYMDLFPEANLSQEDIDVIVRASAIHDIGKIFIPDTILMKPTALTEEERQVMMSHTTKGCEILDLLSDIQDQKQCQVSYDVCRHHHERYDGNGYPDGLIGDEIPLSAQLVSIVDVYDALVSKRVYKQPYSKKQAYQMIINGECGTFSPKIIQAFQHALLKIESFSDRCQ